MSGEQPAAQPTLDRVYAAWRAVGADVAGLDWSKFAATLAAAPQVQAGDTREALAAKLQRFISDVETKQLAYVLLTVGEAKAILAALTEQPAAPRPVAHFLNNAADGEPPHYAQVAAEFIGTEGVIPLYAHPPRAAEPPPGFVLVPKEPTLVMVVAMKEAWWVGGSTHCAKTADAYRVYAAMLAAAPAAPAQEQAQAEPQVCKHGIRSPHECKDCADEPTAAEIAARAADPAQEQFIVGSWHDERLRAVKDFYGIEVTSGPRQGVAAPAQEPQQPSFSYDDMIAYGRLCWRRSRETWPSETEPMPAISSRHDAASSPAAQDPQQPAPTPLSDVVFAIIFDDADVRHEIVHGEAAARARFAHVSERWNAYLFAKIAPAAPAQDPQQPARATRMPPASSTASDEWEA